MFVKHAFACCFFNAFATANVTAPATVAMIARTTSNSANVIPAHRRDFTVLASRNPERHLPPLSVSVKIFQIIFIHEVAQNPLSDLVERIENICPGNTIPDKAANFSFLYLKEKIQRIDRYDLIFGKVSLVVECCPR